MVCTAEESTRKGTYGTKTIARMGLKRKEQKEKTKMAIKEVKEFPNTAKAETIKAKIIADIEEALEKGVNKFEFVGDYNFDNLAPYVKTISEELIRKKARPILNHAKEDLGLPYTIPLLLPKRNDPHFIKVFSCTEKDRKHVYCEIIPENFNLIIDNSVNEEKRRVKYVAK